MRAIRSLADAHLKGAGATVGIAHDVLALLDERLALDAAAAGDETVWQLRDGSKPRRMTHLEGWCVRWAHGERGVGHGKVLWVDFAIYEDNDLSGETHLYPKPGASSSAPQDCTSNIDEARPFVTGFVKFDGCTQWWQSDGGHVDHSDGIEGFAKALLWARKVAIVELLDADEDVRLQYPDPYASDWPETWQESFS